MTDALATFTETEFSYDGSTRTVYRAGSGPGIVVMSEMPGITPNVAAFARRLVDAGFTVAMPQMFGTPGRAPSVGYVTQSLRQGCVSHEFTTWALNRTSPIIDWLRALARDLHEKCGGPGVGAIGMCFTGGFALAMAVDDNMLAPVLSQPSLPFAVGRERKRALGLSDADLAQVAERADLCVLAMRFTGDPAVPGERFAHLREVLGDRVLTIEIENRKGRNPHNLPRAAHSVVTEHLVDEPGHPTREALDQVLAFFKERLAR
ncbi:MAG TPA: dienelactone hydrolase family protein [Acidimicrobiia bacterium]